MKRSIAFSLVLALLHPGSVDIVRASAAEIAPMEVSESVPACDDFYEYANEKWLESNPVPADQSSWSSYLEARARTRLDLRTILEEASRRRDETRDADERLLGTLYCNCMDSTYAEILGVEAIALELQRVARIQDRETLQHEVFRLHSSGFFTPFYLFSNPDPVDATQSIAAVWQSGLSLPGTEYYAESDSASTALMSDFREHIARIFTLDGDSRDAATRGADHVITLESVLAGASMTRLERRDPQATRTKMSIAEVRDLMPHFEWSRYLQIMDLPEFDTLNVSQPRFMQAVDSLLAFAPLDDWKTYLRWRLLRDAGEFMSDAHFEESFRFSTILVGVEAPEPRWQRCVSAIASLLSPVLGQVYAKRTFPAEAKARANEMVANLRAVLRERIRVLDWMDAKTRREALKKLERLEIRIGYPDSIPDYSRMQFESGSFYRNLVTISTFEVERDMKKIGKPVDRSEWAVPPQSISGGNQLQQNIITYPAAKFQPPFFDASKDDAVNYGAIGATIAHEIVHAFDDQGRQYDSEGNIRDWWTSQAEAGFRERADVLVREFDEYQAIDSILVNGNLTLGENIADLGGVTLAYHALQRAIDKNGRPALIDGFTPEQRFFLSWARNWRQNIRPEAARLRAKEDVHSPHRWRTNGPLSNMPEFQAAFHCPGGSAMVRGRRRRASIW